MTPIATAYHRPLHTIALLLTAATFPLIFLGGLVTTYGAGMSVPDWPNSYGYNMFLFPVSQWVGGIFYEHTHRLKGTLVGFLAVMLTLQAYGPARHMRRRKWFGWLTLAFLLAAVGWGGGVWMLEAAGRIDHDAAKKLQHFFAGFASLGLIFAAAWVSQRREERTWLRRLTVVALVAVCIQGLLGGLRVTEVNLSLAIVHGCFAQAFFCLAGFIAVASSRWWTEIAENRDVALARAASTIATWTTACAVIVFFQLIVGATMRHHGAGLAIPDLPLAYGNILPPTTAAGLSEINQHRAWVLHEKPVTLWQIWLHFGHRIGAVVVSIAIAGLLIAGWRRANVNALKVPMIVIGGLWAVQFTLGVLTVYYKKPAEVASLHVACGALLLLSIAVLLARSRRLAAVSVKETTAAQTFEVQSPPRAVAANA